MSRSNMSMRLLVQMMPFAYRECRGNTGAGKPISPFRCNETDILLVLCKTSMRLVLAEITLCSFACWVERPMKGPNLGN
jgi:hypothetical protein